MERPAYYYELKMTRGDGTHIYGVHAPDAGQIGVIESQMDGRRKVWLIQPWYGEQRSITRRFANRTTGADVLYAFWRAWRTQLDRAQSLATPGRAPGR